MIQVVAMAKEEGKHKAEHLIIRGRENEVLVIGNNSKAQVLYRLEVSRHSNTDH